MSVSSRDCVYSEPVLRSLITFRLLSLRVHDTANLYNTGVIISFGKIVRGRSMAQQREWVDGFLLVGNQVALDFLNTRPVLEDGPREFLPNVKALERWLIASGVLTSHKGKTRVRRWRDTCQAD